MTDIDITGLRASIDEVDNKIIALLRERCGYVKQVGMTKKARQKAGRSFIRSGREADMVRRLFNTFSKEAFPAQAAAHLWRIIIAASLSLESSLNVSTFFSDTRQDVYWLAREYFGNFTPISRQSATRRVVADVMDEKAEVGALPMPNQSPDGEWWLKLPEDVKVFACVPFIIAGDAPPSVLLIARTDPEPTGDDITLISIETQKDVSQSRLKAIFDKHKTSVNWLSAESFPSGHRVHLIEMKGFYTLQNDVLKAITHDIDTSLIALRHLGGYAVPIRY
jgi:chorismate mutase / prephenate dehydratase